MYSSVQVVELVCGCEPLCQKIMLDKRYFLHEILMDTLLQRFLQKTTW